MGGRAEEIDRDDEELVVFLALVGFMPF